ncbi:hypothetical protein EHP00_553 [Ecytonucleospora hepatopenaei]|uniref:Uncharacterized protein n=1 Tax=Ecytonucleospora hepatopenaei TaxID=646526 RepID=A0A1W0E8I9_9MICR|nr:hypothetical protein EHP00_553 [Ecytonucleospora hepatopenaei]
MKNKKNEDSSLNTDVFSSLKQPYTHFKENSTAHVVDSSIIKSTTENVKEPLENVPQAILESKKPKYSDKKNLFDFFKEKEGLQFLIDNFKLNKNHSVIEKIDYIIDFYIAWASRIPVRKNLQMNKYEFLKYVENNFVNKHNDTYTKEGEELANMLFSYFQN